MNLDGLKAIYKTFSADSTKPHETARDWFFCSDENTYFSIDSSELTNQEKRLLHTLFPANKEINSPIGKEWFTFLKNQGAIPFGAKGKMYRAIHFKVNSIDNEIADLELAIQAFFDHEVIISWMSKNSGIILEKQNTLVLSIQEYQSIVQTLETDFYVKMILYVGHFYEINENFPLVIERENELFTNVLRSKKAEFVWTLSKAIPSIISHQLDQAIKNVLNDEITSFFKDDPELLLTIKTYIEEYANASVTAKKLYIHRNTLQYRIDKFTEKTGINLKDFHGAITVYLACLQYEQN